MINATQAAEILNLTPTRVRQLLQENALDFVRAKGKTGAIRISPASMTKLIHLRGAELEKKRVVIKQQKGGVGGTTISLFTAVRLAEKGVRVLYVDLDSEANASSYLASDDFDFSSANTFLEVIRDNTPIKDCIVPSKFGNLDLIPSKGLLRKLDRITGDKNPKKLMSGYMDQVEENYDLIIFDIPPTYTKITESAYLAANLIILPYDSSTFSIEGVVLTYEDLLESMKEFDVKDIEIKVLMNKFQGTTIASKDALATMGKEMGDKFLPFSIRNSSDAVTVINEGRNLFEGKANPELRSNIETLCDFIMPVGITSKAGSKE
jgi:chromosome partitioning protein